MIQSIQRAVQIMDFMKEPDKTYSIKDISIATALSSSTVHRILATLVDCGYVMHDEVTHNYKLGYALISLGMAAIHNTKLQELAKTMLKELSSLTQEDAFLMIKSGNNGIAIQKEQGPNNLKVVENFGYEISLHWGAIRKVLLAFQSEEFISEYMRTNFKPTPTRLVLNPEKFIKELEEIRKTKVAISTGDYIPNGVGIGAPIFDHNDKIVASIGIIGTSTRINRNNIDDMAKIVFEIGKRLSRMMGYTRQY